MKNKKLLFPTIILVVAIMAIAVYSVCSSIAKKPTVTEGEFPFSITYEYKGETKTLSGVLECEYSGSCTILNEHNRFLSDIENSAKQQSQDILYQIISKFTIDLLTFLFNKPSVFL